MDKVFMKMMILKGLKYALKSLKSYMSSEDFKDIAKQILAKADNYFEQGGIADTIVEGVTDELREYFGIEE